MISIVRESFTSKDIEIRQNSLPVIWRISCSVLLVNALHYHECWINPLEDLELIPTQSVFNKRGLKVENCLYWRQCNFPMCLASRHMHSDRRVAEPVSSWVAWNVVSWMGIDTIQTDRSCHSPPSNLYAIFDQCRSKWIASSRQIISR